MTTENHKENVDLALLSFVNVMLNEDGETYGWALEDPDSKTLFPRDGINGNHSDPSSANKAAISYARKYCPKLVKAAEKEASEGERYRAAQRKKVI